MFRKLVIVHTVLAAFFFPMGLLYAITGGLYSLEITGKYHTVEVPLTLAAPLPVELSALVAMAERELAARSLDPPSGDARVRKGGTSYYFEWTGTARDVEIHPVADAGQALLKIKETTPHRFFVQLHKAKGADAFKYFAAVWMVGLVGLFLTGGMMAFLSKPYRRLATVAATLGLTTFVALAATS